MQHLKFFGALLLAALIPSGQSASLPTDSQDSKIDQALFEQGQAFQPFQNPKEHRSRDGKLELTLDVDVSRFEGPGVAFNTRLFNGQFPAPTLRIKAGDSLILHVHNNLKPNLPGDEVMNTLHVPNTTNIHLHGMHVSPNAPQDDVMASIDPGESKTYKYSIIDNHLAGSHWYHPHKHGSTALQVNGGMAGALIVEDNDSAPPELRDMEEIIAVMQGIDLEPNAAELYIETVASNNDSSTLPLDLENLYNISRNMLLVSGQYKPVVTMAPGEFRRIRAVNALMSRNLFFGVPHGMRDSCTITVFGFDGVYLKKPRVQYELFMPTGGRVDFAYGCKEAGSFKISVLYENSTWYSTHSDNYTPNNDIVNENYQDMMFFEIKGKRVEQALPTTLPTRPSYLDNLMNLSEDEITDRWTIVYSDPDSAHTINDKLFSMTEPGHTSTLGAIAEWNLTSANTMETIIPSHPHHQHVYHFQMMHDDTLTGGLIYRKGDWRDTVSVWKDVPALIRFPYADFAGVMVIHCHLLLHEDKGMMTWVQVNDPDSDSDKA